MFWLIEIYLFPLYLVVLFVADDAICSSSVVLLRFGQTPGRVRAMYSGVALVGAVAAVGVVVCVGCVR